MIAQLYQPDSYLTAPKQAREDICNGCGPTGWLAKFVPNTIYLLDISKACDIHDWMYWEGKTAQDKERADRVLLNNILRLIEAHGGWGWLQTLRRKKAQFYYEVVRNYGGPAYWAGKVDPRDIDSDGDLINEH